MYNNDNNHVKSFLERHFYGISINSYRKIYFYEKNLFYMQPLWCTAKLDRFYVIYLVLTKEMAQIWHLWQELLKSIWKMWKSEDGWRMWNFDKFWQKSYLRLSIKALKSSLHISAINWLKIFLKHVIT